VSINQTVYLVFLLHLDGFSVKLLHMAPTQTIVSRIVRRYIADNQLSITAFSQALNISRPTLSARLSGTTRWSVDDLDRLIQLGVPIGLDIFGAAAMEEYTHEG